MRTSTLSFLILVVLLLAIPADARQARSQRPRSPLMTNEDVWSPRARSSTADESVSPTGAASSPLRNARAVLEGALTKMSEVSSVRTRVQTSLPTGEREVLIETMKPDRTHIMSADGEMFVIGRKFYVKTGETWNVTSVPAGSKSDVGFDFRTFVKQMMAKSNVRVTGQVVGGQILDGVDTVAYEFAVTDGSETGTVQVCVGKQDGYIRRMFLSGGALEIKIWFTNLNEHFSIEAPM